MTTFKSQMATDMAVFFNSAEFADAAIYTPTTGDPVSCNVIVDHDVLVQADGYDMEVATLGKTVTAKVAEVGTLSRGDTFLVGTTTYTVQRPETNDNVMVTAVVK